MILNYNQDMTDIRQNILNTISERILILDGAMGTMIQMCNPTEEDFRGNRYASHWCELKGCNDVLVLTNPGLIKDIHSRYLSAGADIIETNSFNANAVSMSDYGLESDVREINIRAARLAREAADEWMSENPGLNKWVAGSVGPTNKSLSLSPDVEDASKRSITWDELVAAYREQIEGLIEGGIDILLVETVFDTLNAKAALWAADEAMRKYETDIPVMLSVTLTESGRTLSGQTIEAFMASVSHFNLLSVGLNCGFGAEGILKWVEQLSSIAGIPLCIYPNAGLPNEMGEYDESPEVMASCMRRLAEKGLVNIIGGCCGTTPDHIRAIAEMAASVQPRKTAVKNDILVLSGLEHLDVIRERNFINIGERCNVAGSRKFLRLIKEKSYDEALSIAREQVEAGAQIIDVNMDDAMLDAKSEIVHFLLLIAGEPEIAKVPVMIDSSKWDVIEEALKVTQGKPIVNSISLKDGADEFKRRASYIKRMGAAVVVMAFDETGQADSYERKIEICKRAYEILVNEVGFNKQDIIFDPNVLALATGIEEHNNYGIDFIKAVRWIKNNLPGAKVSGGLSNLSFSFRGNNYVREAMHSVFLYHAISEGMDMAIVNAGAMVHYDEIEKELRDAIEDVIFNRGAEATDNLISLAEQIKSGNGKVEANENVSAASDLSVNEIIINKVLKGSDDGLEEYLQKAHEETGSAIGVIDGPLMEGMGKVGKLFGEGKLFLPQVVKSARIMKKAVSWLNPLIEQEKRKDSANSAGKIVIATVKGDVHDIGKNIVTVVLRCNGYEVIDLGVMIPGDDIVNRAIGENADIIALSGLITPSLEEMRKVAEIMESKGMDIPLMVGGATTSALHTAVKIAPHYSAPVVHTRDAAMMPAVVQQLLNNRNEFAAMLADEQQKLRDSLEKSHDFYSYKDALKRRFIFDTEIYKPLKPSYSGVRDFHISIKEVREYINWRPFFITWKFDASMAEIVSVGGCDHCKAQWLAANPPKERNKAAEAMQLYKDTRRALDFLENTASESIVCRCGFWSVYSDSDNLVIGSGVIIPTLRRQKKQDVPEPSLSLSDFVKSKDSNEDDYIAAFAVTVGEQIANIISYKREIGNDYEELLYQSLADRLVEAATELLHYKVRKYLWGYSPDEKFSPQNILRQDYAGIRPAVGYPSLPDQSVIFDIDKLMNLHEIGIKITENGAMYPSATTCGLMFANPQSRYFMVGEIGDDQREEYARKRGYSADELRKWIK